MSIGCYIGGPSALYGEVYNIDIGTLPMGHVENVRTAFRCGIFKTRANLFLDYCFIPQYRVAFFVYRVRV